MLNIPCNRPSPCVIGRPVWSHFGHTCVLYHIIYMVANEKRWSIRNNSDKSWHYLIQKYVIIDSNFKFQPLVWFSSKLKCQLEQIERVTKNLWGKAFFFDEYLQYDLISRFISCELRDKTSQCELRVNFHVENLIMNSCSITEFLFDYRVLKYETSKFLIESWLTIITYD